MFNLNKVECALINKKKVFQIDLIDYYKLFFVLIATVSFILLTTSFVFANEQHTAPKSIELNVDHVESPALQKPAAHHEESVEKPVPQKTLYDSKREDFDIQLKPADWFHSPN